MAQFGKKTAAITLRLLADAAVVREREYKQYSSAQNTSQSDGEVKSDYCLLDKFIKEGRAAALLQMKNSI